MADDHKLEGIPIGFTSGALLVDPVRLLGLRGREQISKLFEFDLLLARGKGAFRSEEHTSELQSRFDLVCRLLLEKKKNYLLRGLLSCSWSDCRVRLCIVL